MPEVKELSANRPEKHFKKLPTSDMAQFMDQLNSPNKHVSEYGQPGIVDPGKNKIMRVRSNLVLSFSGDASGCGHIRNIFWMTYLNAVFAKDKVLRTCVMPFFYYQHEMLMQSRTLFFPRTMSKEYLVAVRRYKDLQPRYRYRMVYDIDDFVWQGDDHGEAIPEYNFGAKQIPSDVVDTVVNIMSLMDMVCVSTEFLKNYIQTKLKMTSVPIVVLPNSVPRYFYGPNLREPITKKIKKPKLIYTGSPCHYQNPKPADHTGPEIKAMLGDFDNAWREYIEKAVTDNKIHMMCMGSSSGAPWFWKKLEGKPNFEIVPWLNSYQYHIPILEYKPDISFAPLVPNYFNYSKSDIRFIEACAYQAPFIGTVFNNGMPSPYDNCFVKAKEDVTVEQIEQIVDELTEPEMFNDTVKGQWDYIEREGRWMESKKYIDLLTRIF